MGVDPIDESIAGRRKYVAQPDTQINEFTSGTTGQRIEGQIVELTVEPSALEQLAQAVLDGRVSFEQKTSRAGVVRTRVKVMSPDEARAAVMRGEFD